MDKTCKYYKYQKYVSYDSGQTWNPLQEFQRGELMEFNSPDCGSSADEIYKWVVLDNQYECVGYDKYQKLQKYVSYNNGQTWEPVSPTEYMIGGLIEVNSQDCGYESYDMYRWVDFDEICIQEEECEDINALNLDPSLSVIRLCGDTKTAVSDDCITRTDVKGEGYESYKVDSPVRELIINNGCYVSDSSGPPMRKMSNLTALTIANNTTSYPPMLDVNNIFIARIGCGTNNISCGKITFLYNENANSIGCYVCNGDQSCCDTNIYVYEDCLTEYRRKFNRDNISATYAKNILPFRMANKLLLDLFEIKNCQTRIESGASTTCVGVDKYNVNAYEVSFDEGQTWSTYKETIGSLIEQKSSDCIHSKKFIAYYTNSSLYEVECSSSNNIITSDITRGYSTSYTAMTEAYIGSCVTSIYNYAFSGGSAINNSFSHLSSVTISDGVTSIGVDAFKRCIALKNISIPDSITTIGAGAFWECRSLSEITIGSGVTTIGAGAFSGCTSLPIENNIRYADICTVEATDKALTSYTIKNGTKFIGSHTFLGCSGITSVTIPNSVTSIGEHSFDGCSRLTSITIPDSVTSIDMRAFTYCTSLTSIIIPDSVTSIGDSAFYYCSGLTSCTIGSGVTSISWDAFSYCTSLTSITIPDSVTSIGYYSFSACYGLTSITIPNSVTSIGDYAFNGCSSLASIDIPNSVTSIGERAFNGCSSLTNITIQATTPPTLGIDAFYRTNDCPIYVPAESVDTYKAASRWSYYASRIQAIN